MFKNIFKGQGFKIIFIIKIELKTQLRFSFVNSTANTINVSHVIIVDLSIYKLTVYKKVHEKIKICLLL